MNAQDVLASIRKKLAPVEQKIQQHPFLDAIEQGKVPRSVLETFCIQQFFIITSDYRSLAYALHRAETAVERQFLGTLLNGEQQAMQALERFGKALGVDRNRAFASIPLPGAFAYTACVSWLCAYGTPAELATAFEANLEVWGNNCRRMAEALVEKYGFSPEDISFFWLFAEYSGLNELALAVIQEALDGGVPVYRLERAASLLQAYELMYWDALASELPA